MESEPEHEYRRLIDADDPGRHRTRKRICKCFPWAIVAFLLIALIMSLMANIKMYHYPPKTKSLDREHLTCGTNLDDAIKRGCTWDALTQSWLPKECPRAGEAEFLAAGDHIDQRDSWVFYGDKDGSTRVDRSILLPQNNSDSQTRQQWWATEGEHVSHCIYLFQRLAFAVHSGSRMDQKTGNYNHTIHCISRLFAAARKSPIWDTITTTATSGFGYC